MGLNIKNENTTALVRELAKRTGLTQTGAITEAVRSKLAELDCDRGSTHGRRDARRANVQQLLNELRNSVTAAEREQVRAAEQQFYDDAGLPA